MIRPSARPSLIALDADDDAVAVHRLVQVGAGDVDVAADALERPVGHDEAVAGGMRLDAADDQIHPSGRPKRWPRV